jgi:hypothetical protein
MQTAATGAAFDTAHRNGYSAQGSHGGFSYTVATPAPSDTFVETLGANSWLVNEVKITVNVTATFIVSLFNDMLPTLGTRAVAYVNTTALACVLSTNRHQRYRGRGQRGPAWQHAGICYDWMRMFQWRRRFALWQRIRFV